MAITLFDDYSEMLKVLHSKQSVQISIEGKRYCLIKSDQRYFVTEAYCPHMDYPLHECPVNGGYITCLWHSYRFRLSDGQESQQRSRQLITSEVLKSEEGAAVVTLDKI